MVISFGMIRVIDQWNRQNEIEKNGFDLLNGNCEKGICTVILSE